MRLDGRGVLVTGGAGFIGSHLVERLLGEGARVRVLDDLSTGRAENLPPGGRCELERADLRDLAACRAACAGVELVFHLAALGSVPRSLSQPSETVAINVAGTANLLTAARDAGVRRVVYASSSSVYGDSPRSPKREGEEGEPLSPYAASKRTGEQLALVFARCFGLEAVGLRYFNVYGSRQDPAGPYAAVIPRFFAALLAGRACVIHGDGRQSRDFTYVEDVVEANLAAARAPSEAAWGRVFNVGAGRATTVSELERTIRELVGGGPPPRHEPARTGDVRHSLASTEAARTALGFTASVTLREGLERSLEYYRTLGREARPPAFSAA